MLSPQQQLILDCLKAATFPLSSRNIAELTLQKQQTVYNAVNALVRKGFAESELRGIRNKFYFIKQAAPLQQVSEPVTVNGVKARLVKISHMNMRPKDEPLRKQEWRGGKSSLE